MTKNKNHFASLAKDRPTEIKALSREEPCQREEKIPFKNHYRRSARPSPTAGRRADHPAWWRRSGLGPREKGIPSWSQSDPCVNYRETSWRLIDRSTRAIQTLDIWRVGPVSIGWRSIRFRSFFKGRVKTDAKPVMYPRLKRGKKRGYPFKSDRQLLGDCAHNLNRSPHGLSRFPVSQPDEQGRPRLN